MHAQRNNKVNLIAFILFLSLIFSQITIAAHAVLHPHHDFSITVVQHDDHHHDHNDEEKPEHQCPECLLNKSLQHALANNGAIDLDSRSKLKEFVITSTNIVIETPIANYNARAPPSALI